MKKKRPVFAVIPLLQLCGLRLEGETYRRGRGGTGRRGVSMQEHTRAQRSQRESLAKPGGKSIYAAFAWCDVGYEQTIQSSHVCCVHRCFLIAGAITHHRCRALRPNPQSRSCESPRERESAQVEGCRRSQAKPSSKRPEPAKEDGEFETAKKHVLGRRRERKG